MSLTLSSDWSTSGHYLLIDIVSGVESVCLLASDWSTSGHYLQIDIVSGVSVWLLRAPHGVDVLVVVCPVVVGAGGPVVAVREAVPVPAPEIIIIIIIMHHCIIIIIIIIIIILLLLLLLLLSFYYSTGSSTDL